jgi:hypothetical protein
MKISLTEEIDKIKRLYSFQKGDTMLLEENCKKDDFDIIPLCSELIKNLKDKTVSGPFTDSKFYTIKSNEGCPRKCVNTKEEQVRFKKEHKKNTPHKDNILNNILGNTSRFGEGDDPNAGELQKYLIQKGYLPEFRTQKGQKVSNIDWDFGDVSAKAFGDFIKDKLGVNLDIQSLKDLQDYLVILGFSTGEIESSEGLYKSIVWLISFIENTGKEIVNHSELNIIIKYSINNLLQKSIGSQLTNLNRKIPETLCDITVKYPSYLKSIELTEINDNIVKFRGTSSGNCKIGICDQFWNDKQQHNFSKNWKMLWNGEIKYSFLIKDGKFCMVFNIIDINVSSSDTWDLAVGFSINLFNNSLKVHFDTCKTKDMCTHMWSKELKNIGTQLKTQIGNQFCDKGHCLKIDDIIKLIRGKEKRDNIKNLMVDNCTTTPKFLDTPIPRNQFSPRNSADYTV